VLASTFRVTAFANTPSGVDVQFNRGANMSLVNLYDGLDSDSLTSNHFGDADVTLVGNSVGAVHGSLVWDASSNTLHFVKTGGVLAPDTYTLTLYSRAGSAADPGWTDDNGVLLDGDSNNDAGGNYVATFTVADSTARVLSLPDFARAPKQPVNALSNGTAGWLDADGITAHYATGLPITLSAGTDAVYSVDFEVDYDPTLLHISAASVPAVLSGWTVTGNFGADGAVTTPGKLLLSASGSTSPLPSGDQTVVVLTADVPNAAPYGGSEAIRLTNVVVNEHHGSATDAVGDSAVHKAVLFGDATGNGAISGADAADISRVVVHLDTGFYAMRTTDPVIVGDLTGDGGLSGLDASYAAQQAVHLPVPEIPADPSVAPTRMTVQIGDLGATGHPGDTVPTAIRITDSAAGLKTANFTFTYDTSRLALLDSDVALSPYLAGLGGWRMTEHVDSASGTVSLALRGASALPAGTPDLVSLTFEVLSAAPAGTAKLLITGALNDGQFNMRPYNFNDGSIVVAAAPSGMAPASLAAAPAPAGLGAAAVDQVSAGYEESATLPEQTFVADGLDSLLSTPSARKQASGLNTAWDAALLSMLESGGQQ
jgi:hypothetical protein